MLNPNASLSRARTVEVRVTVRIVHPRHRRPHLLGPQVRQRVRRLLARVRPVPLGREQVLLRVRRVLEQVAHLGHLAGLDVGDLAADLDEGVAEAVELLAGLGLGGLDHEGARDGEAHGGRVEAVVLEALGHVGGLDSRRLLEGADVEDELVRAAAVVVGVDDAVVGEEAGHDVVCVEEGDARLAGEPLAAHHEDVGVADGQDGRAAPGSGADGRDGGRLARLAAVLGVGLRVAGEEGGEVAADADGTYSRAAAAVGDAEGLVEVEVADVGADVAGAAEADLGVHVGAVHVDLAAVLVDDAADLLDLGLEDAKGAGVRDHDGGDVLGVLLALGLEVGDVEVARLGVALDGDDLHADHGGAGGVGAVGGDGDEANVSVRLAAALMVGFDGAETGEFTLGAGIGLQADLVEAGDGRQVLLEGGKHGLVARSLLDRGEGVDVGESGVGDGKHFGGGVELHCAGAERDHGVDEGEILVTKVVDISQKLGLRVVLVEYGVLEEGGLALEVGGDGRVGIESTVQTLLNGGIEILLSHVEALEKLAQALQRDTLVKRESQLGLTDLAQVDVEERGLLVSLEGQGVEEDGAIVSETGGGELEVALACDKILCQAGLGPNILGNGLETFGAVVDGVEGAHVGQQSLGGADVAGGLLTANVLLASLQSKAKGWVAQSILGNTDNTSGNLALVLLGAGEESSVGASGNTKSLGAAEGNIGAELAGRLELSEGQEIRGDANETLALVDEVREALVVENTTAGVGVLEKNTDEALAGLLHEFVLVGEDVTDDELNAESLRSGLENLESLGVAVLRNDEGLASALGGVGKSHGHGLGSGSGLIKDGGVGDLEAGQVSDHGLEVEQGLQTALADLGLVGSVAGVPRWVLEDVALDDGGDLGTVVASSNVGLGDGVEVAKLLHLLPHELLRAPVCRHGSKGVLGLPLLHQIQASRFPPDLLWDGLADELLHGGGGRNERLEHLLVLVCLVAEMPSGEGLMLLKLGKGLCFSEALYLAQAVSLCGEPATKTGALVGSIAQNIPRGNARGLPGKSLQQLSSSGAGQHCDLGRDVLWGGSLGVITGEEVE
ncbi:unnamed protein product [Clonostachys rhizophaga]|uniref:Uncharacterized protein n=1 Tax=Clonostachys rhizophaga TaxID=160324 RepID=A0A9N9VXY1_9HYPO|nr:unnamed protein product [Clonostachys rhizophaga]